MVKKISKDTEEARMWAARLYKAWKNAQFAADVWKREYHQVALAYESTKETHEELALLKAQHAQQTYLDQNTIDEYRAQTTADEEYIAELELKIKKLKKKLKKANKITCSGGKHGEEFRINYGTD